MGWILEGGLYVGSYKAEWWPDALEHENMIDFILGPWGDSTDASDRYAASMAHRLTDDGPQFLVIDAAERLAPTTPTYSRIMSRVELVELNMIDKLYAYAEQIVLQDDRVSELAGGWGPLT